MAHSKAELAAFRDGESRMVFAMMRDTSELVYMEDNEANAWRERTRTELMCPVRHCGTSEILAVHRSSKRDGFRHKSAGAGNHKPESAFHVQGKGRVADWLRSTYPRSTTTIEKPSTPARERIADVMIESPSGHRVAFEVQYASLSVRDWKQRHNSYVKQRIADVWVFGHAGDQIKFIVDGQDSAGRLKLNELQQRIAAEGRLVFWLNPITGQIATAEETVYAGGHRYRIPAQREGEIRLSSLEELQLTTGGVTNDHFKELLVARDEFLAETARIEAEEQARIKRSDEEQAARRIRAADWEAARLLREGPAELAKQKELERLRAEALRRKEAEAEASAEAARIAAEQEAAQLVAQQEAAEERKRQRAAAAETLSWLEKMEAVKKDVRRALRARAINTWWTTLERKEVLAHFGGEIPEWLQRNILARANVTAEEWHVRVYIDFLRDNGAWFTCEDVVRRLDDEYAIMIRNEDVERWLAALVTWKILRFDLTRAEGAASSGPALIVYQATGAELPTEHEVLFRRFG